MTRSDDAQSGDETESSDALLREAARVDESSSEAAPVHRPPGSRIGRFVVRGELGRGGMGVVYRAFDDTLNRSVALKVLAVLGGAKADEAKVRLLREARAAASLEHAHVVAIYEVGEHEGAPFIAMELVVGQSLRERMRDPSSLEEKIGWLSEMAEALGAAHDKGIVHRDVKPENVMIKRDGHVKVLDFGIARQSALPVDPSAPTEASGERLGTLTAEGVLVGTPRYMAPEQLHGDKLDGRCDQFAWGVVAYELLAGKPPWDASDAVSLMASILGKDPTPLAEVAPDVPSALAATVARALSKSPKDRFATMSEVIEAMKLPDAVALTPMQAPKPRRAWAIAAGRLGARSRRSVARSAASRDAEARVGSIGGATADGDLSRQHGDRAHRSAAPALGQAGGIGGVRGRPADAPRRGRFCQHDELRNGAKARSQHGCGLPPARAFRRLDVHRACRSPSRSGRPSREPTGTRGPSARCILAVCTVARRRRSLVCGADARPHATTSPRREFADELGLAAERCRATWRHHATRPVVRLSWIQSSATHTEPTSLRFNISETSQAAERAAAACIASSPSLPCLRARADVEAQRGQGERLNATARAMLAVSPNNFDALDCLARAEACLDRPAAAMRRAEEGQIAAVPPAQQPWYRINADIDVAEWEGDFSTAGRLNDDLRRLQGNSPEMSSLPQASQTPRSGSRPRRVARTTLQTLRAPSSICVMR